MKRKRKSLKGKSKYPPFTSNINKSPPPKKREDFKNFVHTFEKFYMMNLKWNRYDEN